MSRATILIPLCLAACAPPAAPIAEISGERLLADIAVLAADSLEGRRPGTIGEDRTIAFLTSQFEAIGLEPGNPDGSWTQPLTLVGITGTPIMTVTRAGNSQTLDWKTDYVAQSRREVTAVDVADAGMVFVGYGVTAPEYGWDDFKGEDVRGKTVVMLVGDPPVRLVTDSLALDPEMFRAEAMTYYGRWTYKYEEATRRGAAAVLVVHQTAPAGYPWEVVEGGWSGERMDVSTADGHADRVAVEGWLSEAAARRLFADAGLDFDQQEALARTTDFRPVDLGASASIHIDNTLRTVNTHNVIAQLPGSDPEVSDEYVIFTAHWDHFGIGAPVDGDSIYNGALDNASGTAALLELARAFSQEGAPRRTLLFLAVTAEEQGLLGSKWYAENPLYPLERTVADINLDGMNVIAPTSDLVVIGLGNSTLDDLLGEEAAARDRTLTPDAEPEKGLYYRSDHFEFAKQGVPALFTDPGTHAIGHPEDYMEQRRDAWTAEIYHSPADQVDSTWDIAAAVPDLTLLMALGRRVANDEAWPTWKPGTEFKAVREASLAPRDE
jgi:Zn-dependent M28 family amino/carboxypeptidase